jgi:flagella basal body P-ring formation protein FlgA
MNGRPLGKRATIRLLIALTILAWATQTLMHQWGYGADVEAPDAAEPPPAMAPEQFVPAPERSMGGMTLELRSEATVSGGDIRLRQICRWSKADAPALNQPGELVVAHFDGGSPFKTISLDEIRSILRDAGVNVSVIDFAGPTSCTVSRSDVEYDQATSLDQWITAHQPAAAAPAVAAPAASAAPVTPVSADASPVKSLRDLLQADLAVRLSLPPEELQINFNPADEKLLNLCEPQFKFNIDGSYIHNLGDVSWEVLIVTDSGTKKVTIAAGARAWQHQLVLASPLSFGQVIRPADVTQRRLLSDRLADNPEMAMDQVVGQQAARDLQTGMVFTPGMVAAMPLARTGQLVTVTANQGSVSVKTVAKAMEGGSYGQTIRVKNEATDEIYEVVLTGPQAGTMGPAAPLAQARADAR